LKTIDPSLINNDENIIQNDETNRNEILMEIFELNEMIDSITSSNQYEQLNELETKLNELMKPLENNFNNSLKDGNYKKSIENLHKMKYYKNIDDRLQDLKLKFNLE
jgi:DnaJ-domain-containing protein 1